MLVFTRQWHIQERNCKKIMVDKLSVLTNTALKSRIYCNSRHKASGVHISEVVAIFSFLERMGWDVVLPQKFYDSGTKCLKKSWNPVCCISEYLVSRNNSGIPSSHQVFLPLFREKDILSWLLVSFAAFNSISFWIWVSWMTLFCLWLMWVKCLLSQLLQLPS